MHADDVPHKVKLLLKKIKTTGGTAEVGADQTDAAAGVPAAVEPVDTALEVPAEGAHKTAAAAARAAEAIWLQKNPEPDRASAKYAGDGGGKVYQKHLVKWRHGRYQVCYLPTVRCNRTLAQRV